MFLMFTNSAGLTSCANYWLALSPQFNAASTNNDINEKEKEKIELMVAKFWKYASDQIDQDSNPYIGQIPPTYGQYCYNDSSVGTEADRPKVPMGSGATLIDPKLAFETVQGFTRTIGEKPLSFRSIDIRRIHINEALGVVHYQVDDRVVGFDILFYKFNDEWKLVSIGAPQDVLAVYATPTNKCASRLSGK